jgi:hypothetical protein
MPTARKSTDGLDRVSSKGKLGNSVLVRTRAKCEAVVCDFLSRLTVELASPS